MLFNCSSATKYRVTIKYTVQLVGDETVRATDTNTYVYDIQGSTATLISGSTMRGGEFYGTYAYTRSWISSVTVQKLS